MTAVAPLCPVDSTTLVHDGLTWACPRCDYRLTAAVAREITARKPRRDIKAPHERQRRMVHVLLRDQDFLDLLIFSDGAPLSQWVRECVVSRLNELRAQRAATQTTEDHPGDGPAYDRDRGEVPGEECSTEPAA